MPGAIAAQLALGTVAMAEASTGPALGWGDNVFGQVGDGTSDPRLSPVAVHGLGSNVLAIAVGGDHALALRTGGTVVAWGFNNGGQVGDGSTTARLAPTPVAGISGGIAAIAAGDSHSLALTSGGAVLAWGHNTSGQVGDGSTAERLAPVQVAGLTSGIVAIAAGGDHSLAIRSDGTVLAWGKNDTGELGDGTTTQRSTPVLVPGLSGIKAISGGRHHNLALRNDGTVLAWGFNSSGQLGDGTTTDRHAPQPVGGLTGIKEIAAGGDHSMSLDGAGKVLAWGDNQFGQLGNGTQSNRSTPVQVSGLTTGVLGITAGWDHSLAIRADQALLSWGDNTGGQLGLGGGGATSFRVAPAQVPGASGIGAISAGDVASVAVPGIPGATAGALGSKPPSAALRPGLPGTGYLAGLISSAQQGWSSIGRDNSPPWTLGVGSLLGVAVGAALAAITQKLWNRFLFVSRETKNERT